MARAFPDHIVQCHGEGTCGQGGCSGENQWRTQTWQTPFFQMQSEIDSLHAEVAKMRRSQELMFHNLAALTKEWMEVNPELAELLHPMTPQSLVGTEIRGILMTALEHGYSVDIVPIWDSLGQFFVLASFLQTIALLTFHR